MGDGTGGVRASEPGALQQATRTQVVSAGGSRSILLRQECDDIALRLTDLNVEYLLRSGTRLRAVRDVSIDLRRGETLGLVGESGCGKSSLGRAIVGVPEPISGAIAIDGQNVLALKRGGRREVRRKVQMIFQDPISSLNPQRSVVQTIEEPLAIRAIGDAKFRRQAALKMMTAVGLDPSTQGSRRPLEFSGGQCQRVAIGRALVSEPEVLICDEPVSALDVSVQAQVLNLLGEMKDRYQLAVVFISHDLSVVKLVADRVAVMYLGTICEMGASSSIFESPAHPYTVGLMASVPRADPKVRARSMEVIGEIPSPIHPPSGCRYHTRCPFRQAICVSEEPEMRRLGPDHFVACHFPVSARANEFSPGRPEGPEGNDGHTRSSQPNGQVAESIEEE